METGELPSMGAAVAECGRSLSAWAHFSTRGRARVTRMGQSDELSAGSQRFAESLYLACADADLPREQLRQRRPALDREVLVEEEAAGAETTSSQGESCTR